MSARRGGAYRANGRRAGGKRTPTGPALTPTERGYRGHVCLCGQTPTREPDEVLACCHAAGLA